ncbi:MAG: Adenosylmethionine-8-amino-7-oxononanoate aminotransferase [Acidimicrobiales bacterium]|nr:Adenosylmethionine-8-amino-7-oxononanoate aminotransferase [Acidimicrobiales bacterium]
MDLAGLLETDRSTVWHPYAAMPAPDPARLVTSASGACIDVVDPALGLVRLVDGMASWWSAVHGYRHPVLDRAATDQLGKMSHVMFGGLTHEPAIHLAERLVELAPGDLAHVFFSDSGSVAVEVAMKMCLQHWLSLGRPSKRRFLTWRGGYHGDTWSPMSVCDPEGGMHHHWSGLLAQQVFADVPPAGFDAEPDEAYRAQLRSLVAADADDLAAIIVEPVMQGAGGMRFHNPAYLRDLRALADEHDVLLIFDEIATGFGRTGAFFAAEHAGIAPDVMCVGKALTGGYLSMGATLCTPRVAAGIAAGEVPVLAHGPTFMANPLAAAIANASLDVLDTGAWSADVARIEAGLRSGLSPLADAPGVADVRVLGAVGVVQLDHDVDVAAATAAAIAAGAWLRPFRDLIYTTPPFLCTDEEIATITAAIAAAAAVA